MSSSSKSQADSNRWAVLGLVRFVLSLVVAANHLPVFISRDYNGGGILPWLQLFPGTGAVLVFLVISGYSIGASVERSVTGFYRRRALRVLPLYYSILLTSAVIPAGFGGIVTTARVVYYTPSIGEVVANVFFGQGFFFDAINTDRVVWSLSVEVFFYLLTPLLLRLKTWHLGMLMATSVLWYLASKVVFQPTPAFYRYGGNTLTLGWTWILGFWIHRNGTRRIALLTAAAMGFVPAFFTIPGFLFLWEGCLIAIGLSDRAPLPNWVRRGCETLGDISYPLYLLHIPLFTLLYGMGYRGSSVWLVLLTLASFLLDRGYDRPVKRLVRGFLWSGGEQGLTRAR